MNSGRDLFISIAVVSQRSIIAGINRGELQGVFGTEFVPKSDIFCHLGLFGSLQIALALNKALKSCIQMMS